MAEIFQTFLLIATFDIALIAITIANYAVSASYLGRETQVTRWRLEKRKDQLNKKVKELQAKGALQLQDLKTEIRKTEDEQAGLGTRIVLLSWIGAIVIPCILFIVSLIIAVLGMNSDILISSGFVNFLNTQLIGVSSIFLAGGFIMLLIVIRTIDFAAKNIPVPQLTISFEKYAKELKLQKDKEAEICLWIENEGEDIAERIEVFVEFPPEFKIPEQRNYSIIKQPLEATYPNYNAVIFDIEFMHIENGRIAKISLVTPNDKKTFEIPVNFYEMKTGLTKKKLSIQIED